MKIKRTHILLGILILSVCALPFRAKLRRPVVAVIQRIKGRKTVADRVEQFGSTVHGRLSPYFQQINVSYPPDKITLVGLKQEELLEVWVSDGSQFKLLKTYPILCESGTLGPKLKEGDNQVPEGLYRIESLNPNSMFHLSLRVNYPNAIDQSKAELDGRTGLGCDIMIHGNDRSIGCLAMGDAAAEDLFVLAAETGIDNVSVILSPVDFRKKELPGNMPKVPLWTDELYESIRNKLNKLKQANQGMEPTR